jgi:hypothetical protein
MVNPPEIWFLWIFLMRAYETGEHVAHEGVYNKKHAPGRVMEQRTAKRKAFRRNIPVLEESNYREFLTYRPAPDRKRARRITVAGQWGIYTPFLHTDEKIV